MVSKTIMSIDETAKLLELPADLVGEDPDVLKQRLLSALAAQSSMLVSGKAVTRVGTAALQLLVAFRRECETRALPFELRDPSPALLETLACVGLGDELGVPGSTQ